MTTYDRKVQALIDSKARIKYVPCPMTRKTDWRADLKQGLYHVKKLFFRVLTVMGYRDDGSELWMQPVMVQEAQQYDESACHQVVGIVEAPVRTSDSGELEVAVMAWVTPGAYGEVIFSFPRRSWSNDSEMPEGKRVVYERLIRADAARMTGQVQCLISLDPGSEISGVEWFTLSELALLAEHERFCDSYSQVICQKLLRDPGSLFSE